MATPTSGQAAAQQNGTAKTGKKRKVASAAGAARYHKPIGSEIGSPRDANHAAIQSDQGARRNYGDLINGDPNKQRQALEGMSTADLNKLADIAFSFKSSDPKVVALRIAARNAQAKRGIRPGQTQTRGKVAVSSKKVLAKKKPVRKAAAKPAPAPAGRNMRGSVKAMSRLGPASRRLIELAADTKAKDTSKFGNYPVPDVAHVRKAIQAIGRAKPEQRPAIARHIIARAKALNCEHLISDNIRHYARGSREPGTVGMSQAEADAIELAGRWKHGWIPLDAVAHASKMKGGKGKPWWEGSGNLKPHGSPKSGSPGSSGKLTNVVKSGSAASKPRGAKVNEPHPLTRSRKPISQMSPAERATEANRADQMASRQPDRSAEWELLAKQLRAGSASSKKVAPNAAFSRATMIKRAKENGLSQVEAEKWADNPNRPMLLGNKAVGPSRTPKPGQKQDTTGKSKLTFEPAEANHRTQIAHVNMEHDAAVAKARREGTQPPKFPYDKVTALKSDEAQHNKEAKIAERIASGKGKTTTGVLSPAQAAAVKKLQDAGKHDEAGALSRKHLTESKARIAKLVEAKRGAGPGKA